MNRKKRAIIFYVLMAIALSGIFLSSCSEEIKEGSVIFTQTTANNQETSNLLVGSLRYNIQSRIASVNPDNPDKTFRVLTSGFYSALSPQISFDGKFLLFAGQKSQYDKWQIWEMNLRNSKVNQITSEKENAIDPAYLPGGRIVFTRNVASDSTESVQPLFTCNIDGSDIRKITFNPYIYSSSNVLNDGRILTICRQVYPEQKKPLMMVLRPDGTKAELFYSSPAGSSVSGPGIETSDGKIIFIEYEKSEIPAGDLISISYNRPLHSRVNYSSNLKGSFHSAAFLKSGKLLVSYRPAESENYSLFEFDIESGTLGERIFNSAEYDAVEPVLTGKRNRPKKLPSEVDMGVKTGLLLCQDINFTGRISEENAEVGIADRIEIIGADSSLGIVKAEKDGSLYLKVIADTPFRIRTLDEKGNTLNETCDWVYVRPNERRGCVGCHESHELVPENKLPLAVKKAPSVIPVHKTKIKEKVIELE